MTSLSEEDLNKVLTQQLLNGDDDNNESLDEDMISYLTAMLGEITMEEMTCAKAEEGGAIYDAIQPFLEGVGCTDDTIVHTCRAICDLAKKHASKSKQGGTIKVLGQKDTNSLQKLSRGISMAAELEQSEAERDANAYMWGKDGVKANSNTQRDAHKDTESAKAKRIARKELERVRREYESKLRALEEEEKENSGKAVANMVLPDYNTGRNERDIQVRKVNLSLDNGRSILDDGELRFSHRHRYGLVGKNGIGKTTLLKAIARMEIPNFPRHHRVLHVRQEVSTIPRTILEARTADGTLAKELPVLQIVIESDVERNTLLTQEKEILKRLEIAGEGTVPESSTTAPMSASKKREELLKKQQAGAMDPKFANDLKRLDEVYARLSVIGADAAEARASMILSGLQFTPEMQSGPLSALSGGWKMRVSLAAALFIEPDLLMLDEPTNHLDLEAVLWLESYLVEYKHTVIVVSHDRGFLNEVCTDIIEFSNQKLNYFKGNFDTYVKTAAEDVKNRMRVYQAYQDKRAHMMEFITKFRANAKRSTLVQSRIKAVEKMDAEAPAEVVVDAIWTFSIPNPEPLGRPIISIDDVSFDYSPSLQDGSKKPESQFLLQKVNFGVDLDSRIGILGPNGAGKSTLVNLIMDKIAPVKGSVARNSHLRLGHFTQHSADKFDLELSAVENMLVLYDNAQDQEMRSFLGRFQIQGEDALKPMMMLSGGQKSRVAFAALAYQKPHVIVMDEPTNHLDMESIDALVGALLDFRGGLMVVSHDQFFITKTCQQLVVVGDGKVIPFTGGFDAYKKETMTKTAKRVAESVKLLSTMNN